MPNHIFIKDRPKLFWLRFAFDIFQSNIFAEISLLSIFSSMLVQTREFHYFSYSSLSFSTHTPQRNRLCNLGLKSFFCFSHDLLFPFDVFSQISLYGYFFLYWPVHFRQLFGWEERTNNKQIDISEAKGTLRYCSTF